MSNWKFDEIYLTNIETDKEGPEFLGFEAVYTKYIYKSVYPNWYYSKYWGKIFFVIH